MGMPSERSEETASFIVEGCKPRSVGNAVLVVKEEVMVSEDGCPSIMLPSYLLRIYQWRWAFFRFS